jgi:hypothetical protein
MSMYFSHFPLCYKHDYFSPHSYLCEEADAEGRHEEIARYLYIPAKSLAKTTNASDLWEIYNRLIDK